MKLSSKARYGLACTLYIAHADNRVSVSQLSTDLNLSPLYLQQVMAALKVGNILISSKGSSGGYQLSRMASKVSVYDCLNALEPSLFEQSANATDHEDVQHVLEKHVFEPLDKAMIEHLQGISLKDLSDKLKEHQSEALMFYI